MKLTHLALAASVAIGLGSAASAATLNVSNSNFQFDGNDFLFLDNAGNPLTEGFVGLSTTPDSGGLLADSIVAIGPGNSPLGVGLFNSPLNSANDGSLNDQNLFVLVGVSDTFQGVFGSLDTGLAFVKADTPPPPDSQFYSASAGNVVVGGSVAVTIDASGLGGPAAYNTTGLQLVPEPSSTLLFGLAGMALFLRRKR